MEWILGDPKKSLFILLDMLTLIWLCKQKLFLKCRYKHLELEYQDI